MRPDFWFGVAVIICGLAIIAWAAQPPEPVPPQFWTLAIWQDAETGRTGIIRWIPEPLTKAQIENESKGMVKFYDNMKLQHVFTIQGSPVDVEQAQLIQEKTR